MLKSVTRFLFFVLFFLVSVVHSAQEELQIHSIGVKAELSKTEIKSKSGKTLVWRFSDKKEPHLIQGYNNTGQLVLEKYDSDGNKIFEKIIEIDIKKSLTTENFDLNQDGKVEKIKKVLIRPTDILITIHTFNSKGEYELESEKTVSREEALHQTEICDGDYTNNPIFKSVEAFVPLTEKLFISEVKDAYSHTSYGPMIHESCMKQFGEDYPSQLQITLRDSLNCLSMLDGPASRENITKIASILENKSNPLKLRCGEDLGEGTSGLATIPGEKNFPMISISKNHQKDKKSIKSTVFHELLHNCGYIHESSQVEYMYACPSCCEAVPLDKSAAACKICRGDYSDTKSFDYQLALTEVSYSVAAPQIVTSLMNGDFSHRKDGPLLFLKSIQYSQDYQSVYEQMYTYYKAQGILTDDNSSYLIVPQRSVAITPAVQGLADAISKTSPGGTMKSMSYLFKGSNDVIINPPNSAIRKIYIRVIRNQWADNNNQLKKNPTDAKLKAQEAFLWKLLTKVDSKK